MLFIWTTLWKGFSLSPFPSLSFFLFVFYIFPSFILVLSFLLGNIGQQGDLQGHCEYSAFHEDVENICLD